MSTIKLTSACNITTGKLDANAAVENGEYPYFTCAPEPLRIDIYAFDEDAILLAGNNASGNFHCQRFKGKFNAYQRTYVITAKEGYDIEYIYYNLLINLQLLKKIAQGSQTKFLTMEILNGFELDDIPYEAQKELVKSLVSINSKIANNSTICSILESMAKLLYDYWFVQFDFPDENGKPYKSSGGKMVWNEELSREIPEGWEVSNLNRITNNITDGVHESVPNDDNGQYLLLSCQNIKNGELDRSNNVRYIGKEVFDKIRTRTNLSKGDVLLSSVGTIGETLLLLKEPDNIEFQRSVAILKPNLDLISSEWLYETLLSLKTLLKRLAHGAVQKCIFIGDLSDMKVVLPPYSVISLYTSIVQRLFYAKTSLKDENQKLSELLDFLLPMLMNGQVKILN